MRDPHPVRSYQYVNEALEALAATAEQLYELSNAPGLTAEHKALLARAMHVQAEQVEMLYRESLKGLSTATQSYCVLVS